MSKYENKGRSVEEAGIEVKKLSDTSDLNADWRRKHGAVRGAGGDLALDSQARELEEDTKVVDVRRKIIEIMEEDQPTPKANTGTLRRRQPSSSGPGLSMDDLLDGLSGKDLAAVGFDAATDEVARGLVHEGYAENPNEASLMAESHASDPRATDGTWDVKKFGGRIKGSDKVVPVWKVLDESTGMQLPKNFRIQEPAQRIATILNQSGNVNDARIKGILEAYDKHVDLMKRARQARKAIKEGRSEFEPKLQMILGELEAVNYKLGI